MAPGNPVLLWILSPCDHHLISPSSPPLHTAAALKVNSNHFAAKSEEQFQLQRVVLCPPDWLQILEVIPSWATCPLTLDELILLRDLTE